MISIIGIMESNKQQQQQQQINIIMGTNFCHLCFFFYPFANNFNIIIRLVASVTPVVRTWSDQALQSADPALFPVRLILLWKKK